MPDGAELFWRQGFDEGVGAVDPFAEREILLDRVAGDLAAAYAEVARSREETARIKSALREWQSRQAPSMRDLAGRP